MVGITMRVGSGRRARLLHTLHWTSHGQKKPVDLRDDFPPEAVQPGPTALERAAAVGVSATVVSARRFENPASPGPRCAAAGFGASSRWATSPRRRSPRCATPGRQLCYAYHADLDAIGHEHGPGTLPWRLQLAAVDRLAALIAENLPSDAVLAVTGDHGMISDGRAKVDIDETPVLTRGVDLVGGDARARLVYDPALPPTCSRRGRRPSATAPSSSPASRRSRKAGSARSPHGWSTGSATSSPRPAGERR